MSNGREAELRGNLFYCIIGLQFASSGRREKLDMRIDCPSARGCVFRLVVPAAHGPITATLGIGRVLEFGLERQGYPRLRGLPKFDVRAIARIKLREQKDEAMDGP